MIAPNPRLQTDVHQCRVALVTTELREGGAEKCLAQLAARIDPDCFDTRVFCLAPPPPAPRDRLWRELHEAGVTVHALGLQSGWQLPYVVSQLVQAWQDWKPDIVQSFLFHADVVASHVCRRLQIPIHNLGLRVAEPSRWRGWWERLAAQRAERVVAVSASVANHAMQHWGIPREKLVVIPNGIDPSVYDTAQPVDWRELEVPASRQVIAIVGRLEPQKGIDRIVEHLPDFFRVHRQAHLVIVGEGSQRGALERQFDAAGVSDRVSFLGWRNDVPAILKASRVLLLPSRYEGMPNVVLDAMACRLPVAAFEVAGLAELLISSGNPWVRQGDVPGLLQLAGRAIDDRRWAERVGLQNSQIVRTRFSLDGMVGQYERLYWDQWQRVQKLVRPRESG